MTKRRGDQFSRAVADLSEGKGPWKAPRTTEGTTMKTRQCTKLVNVRGGQAMAATRQCSGKVVYTDHLGRGWCRRHQPDAETRERWRKIGEVIQKHSAPMTQRTTEGTTMTTEKTFKNNWDVKCHSCGAAYVDHRRRVGKCLKCKSAAVIALRSEDRHLRPASWIAQFEK